MVLTLNSTPVIPLGLKATSSQTALKLPKASIIALCGSDSKTEP